MSASEEATPLQSLLSFMRPRPGMELSHALVATYSVDLVVVAAAIAAMAAFGGDNARVDRVSLARSLRDLKGRVAIRAQAGCVKAPPDLGPFHALLLGFVSDVRMPNKGQHWHPKFFLLRFAPVTDEKGSPEWRIWLGSHNLVRSSAWELGACVESQRGGRRIAGLNEQIVRAFSAHSQPLDAPIAEEVRALRWDAGEPTEVTRFDLLGDTHPRWRSVQDAREAYLVSPFLDAEGLAWLDRCLPKQRTLVTTREELERLAAKPGESGDAAWRHLAAYKVIVVGAPHEQPSTLSFEGEEGGDDDAEDDRGVHAKALFAREDDEKWMLQFGSANATRRGLALSTTPANAEVVAAVHITDAMKVGLLHPVLNRGQRITLDELVAMRAAGQAAKDAPKVDVQALLGDLIAGWSATQECSSEATRVVGAGPPQTPEGFELKVATLLSLLPPVHWPNGAASLDLPGAPSTETSNYLLLELTSSDGDGARALMYAAADPPRDDAGDLALLRRALGPRGLLEWLRGRLDGVVADDTDWDSPPKKKVGGVDGGGKSSNVPAFEVSIEDVLRAYARDHARAAVPGAPSSELHALDKDMARLDLAAFTLPNAEDSVDDASARQNIQRFLTIWAGVRRTLLPPERVR